MTPAQLLGGWEFSAWQIRQPDGRVSMPFGVGGKGLLLYTPDGYMSATIMAADRPPLSNPIPRLAAPHEKVAAHDSYFSYAGLWRIEGERVLHTVTVALNPDLVGSLQWREATLDGPELTLSVKEKTHDGERRHELIWRRLGG